MQLMVLRVLPQFRISHRQQWPPMPLPVRPERHFLLHGGKPIHAGAAQQPQQHCLSLIPLVVGCQQAGIGRHCLLQGGIARCTGSRLRALRCKRIHCDVQGGQGNLPLHALRLTMSHPVISTVLQSMVHMHGLQARKAGRLGQMQKHGGVETTAIGHHMVWGCCQ